MTELMTLIFADQKTNTLPLIFTDDTDLKKPNQNYRGCTRMIADRRTKPLPLI